MVVIKVLQERIYYISTFFSQKTIKDCKLYFNFDKTRKKWLSYERNGLCISTWSTLHQKEEDNDFVLGCLIPMEFMAYFVMWCNICWYPCSMVNNNALKML